MGRDWSILWVVAIGATTGALLGRGAGAVVAAPPSAPPPAAAGASAAANAPSATRDEGESDEPHGDSSGEVNPYDDAGVPPHAANPFRITVPVRDGMLHLPGGKFVMGSASLRAPSNERPARPLVVPPFWIDRTEVTVDGYRACVKAGACARPARASANCTYDAGDPDLPVSCVHYADAEGYCRFVGKRLPSEREWEYAARGAFAVPFPWGGGSSCANAITLINEQSGRSCASHPARVGSHPGGASVFGVQDMSGNVEEWTADWYVELLGPGPAPRSGAARVLRGGGWLSTPSQSRTTARNWGSALEAGANVGFRCAKDTDAAAP